MANRGFLILIAVAAVALLFAMSAFTVRETEMAIKFRFGEIVRSDYQPGLHFMTPFVNKVQKFDKRVLTGKTTEGKLVDSRDLVGKQAFMLVYFATWCGVCRMKLPMVKFVLEHEAELQAMQKELEALGKGGN